MKDKKHIDEDGLGKLLNTYSLNKLSVDEDVDMANAVFEKDYGVKMSSSKEKKLLDKLGRENGDNN